MLKQFIVFLSFSTFLVTTSGQAGTSTVSSAKERGTKELICVALCSGAPTMFGGSASTAIMGAVSSDLSEAQRSALAACEKFRVGASGTSRECSIGWCSAQLSDMGP